jgi:hypothetical protein
MTQRSEPAVITGIITAFVTAAIGLLVAFGLDITEDQTNAILGMTAVLAPIIAALVIRSQVFAPDTVRDLIDGRRPDLTGVPPEQWGVNIVSRKDQP